MYVYIKAPFMAIKDAVNSETILCMVNYTLLSRNEIYFAILVETTTEGDKH